ncbi:MAG: DNA-directed RNA polymerase subunit D [Candidatus Aenigmatarchaeota archaeon]
MKIKIIKKSGNDLEFTAENISIPLANALRRIMISEVPTLSVDWIDIHNNTSVLFDEMISHRIGLIPIKFNPDKFNFIDDCKCEGKGCTLCQAVFSVTKKGPCIVYSGDMKPANKEAIFTDPKFPIVELLENQEIKLDAIARLGIGQNHSKNQAAIAAYEYDGDGKALKFKFKIESVSGLKPDYIVEKAAHILELKAAEFKKEVNKI